MAVDHLTPVTAGTLEPYWVLVTTTATHLVQVGAVSQADAIAQIEDNGGTDLDQLLGPDTRVAGDFTVRVPAGEWDARLVAEHSRSQQRHTGPVAA